MTAVYRGGLSIWICCLAALPVFSAPPDSTTTIQPLQLWHVGQDDGPESIPLGHIIDIAVDENGNSYMLDESLVAVRMFDERGDYIRDMGRQGEGPGEFQMPVRVDILPGGNLGVVQRMPARVIMLDKENSPLGYFLTPGGDVGRRRISKVGSSSDHVVVSRSVTSIEGQTASTRNTLDIFQANGEFIATAMESTKQSKSRGMSINDGREFNGLATCWDFSSDGRLFVAPYFNEYKILVFNSEGVKERTIETRYESVKRSARNMEELERDNDLLRRVEGKSVDINPYVRDIDQLFCRPNGELWVLSSQGLRDCPDHQLGYFNVHDTDGHYLKQVSLEVDYNQKRDGFIIDGNRLFILKESKMMPATQSSASHGGSMVVMMSMGPEKGESEKNGQGDPRPFSVICYRLD